MKVLQVYKANNGDVFFQHDNAYQPRTKQEIAEVIKKAHEMYKNGQFKEIEARLSTFSGIGYHDGDEFIGTAGVHVLERFHQVHNCIFLHRVNNKKSVVEKMMKDYNRGK